MAIQRRLQLNRFEPWRLLSDSPSQVGHPKDTDTIAGIRHHFVIAFRDMIDTMNNGSKIASLGIAPTGFETSYKMIAFVQTGLDLSPLIPHRIGIDDCEAGFAAMRSGKSGKVVMDW